MQYTIAIAFILLASQGCSCWWDEGHMIVAQVAAIDLKQTVSDEAVQLFEVLTKVLESMRHGKINTFVESATWPDEVKSYAMHVVDGWHFTDIEVQEYNPKFYIDPSSTVNSIAIVVISQYYILLE